MENEPFIFNGYFHHQDNLKRGLERTG